MWCDGFLGERRGDAAELRDVFELSRVDDSRFGHVFPQQRFPQFHVVVSVRPHQPRSAGEHLKGAGLAENLVCDFFVELFSFGERSGFGGETADEDGAGGDAADEVEEVKELERIRWRFE
jgi:hypothetical protein